MHTEMKDISIRKATIADSEIIARCVLAAIDLLDIDEDVPTEMQDSVSDLIKSANDDSRLYCYQHSYIAECNGKAIGCLIAYNGDNYAQLRKNTFDRLYEKSGLDLRNNPMETMPGEFYLDCMAIHNDYRGNGIGHQLMSFAIEQGKTQGIKTFTLLVEKSHTRLKEYYSQLGFEPVDEMFAFGNNYVKMKMEIE